VDKEEVIAALVIATILGGFICLVFYEFQQKQGAIPVSLKELVVNKEFYEGKYVKVEGTLVECLEEGHKTWLIPVPTTIFMGEGTMVSIVLIPVLDKYYVYSLTDGHYTIAILSETELEQYLGSQVTVVGKVDGVKDVNGDTLDYVINVEVVQKRR